MSVLPSGLDLASIAMTVLTLLATIAGLLRIAQHPRRYGEDDPQPMSRDRD